MSQVAITNLQAAVELPLCKLDYDQMADDCPEIMEPIEAAINSGIDLETVRGWIERTTTDNKLSQQLYNAARWYEASKG